MCGASSDVPTTAAADVPLFSAGLRLLSLRALGLLGIRRIVSTSGLGYKFVCHIGDLAEFPFYHRRAFESELAICSAWLQQDDRPVVYDVGANVGFFATHLAQMLASWSPQIYAFEPVPTTFIKLVQSVQRLGLHDVVHPVGAAVTDHAGPVRIAYSDRNSMYAQVTSDGPNPRVGSRVAHAAGITLDRFQAYAGERPALLKIDVEGSEVAVLRGAEGLLSRPDRPAIMLEHNPTTLSECGVPLRSLHALLSGYALHYVDDLDGQRMPFGNPIAAPEHVDWTCNLFAVPRVEGASARWTGALQRAKRQLERSGR
jgi:FkbM family methyltransferase